MHINMTQEEKDLLLKDLCGRLVYGVKTSNGHGTLKLSPRTDAIYVVDNGHIPYLRPMSSMTEEERNDFENISHNWFYVNEDGEIYPMGRFTDSGEFEDGILAGIDYLIKNHYDFRDLIPKGLALEAPEGMY